VGHLHERDADSARWRHGEDPGDRSRMMENQKGYERAGGRVARTGDWHPASDKARSHKVAEGHPGDARVAGVCQIGSQTMRIVPTNNDIQI